MASSSCPRSFSISRPILAFLCNSPFKPPPPLDYCTTDPLQWATLWLKLPATCIASSFPLSGWLLCPCCYSRPPLTKPPFAHPQDTPDSAVFKCYQEIARASIPNRQAPSMSPFYLVFIPPLRLVVVFLLSGIDLTSCDDALLVFLSQK